MILPGLDIQFKSNRQSGVTTGDMGIVLMPLIGHDYGPEKEFISISAAEPYKNMGKLGYGPYDDNPGMMLVREALKNAAEVIVYIPKQGAKASGTADAVTATAKYGGSRGNDLKLVIEANPAAGFDVTVYLGAEVMETFGGLATVGDLKAAGSVWMDFDGDDGDALEETAGTALTGGADGVAANKDISDFLDASELINWNVMAFPVEADGGMTAVLEMAVSKIKYLRETANKYRALVLSGLRADYNGVVNVTDGVVLEDGTELTPAQVTAWVAGADAGAGAARSNTYRVYEGAKKIANPKSKPEREDAVRNGEYVFTYRDDGAVVVQYDINSLVSFAPPANDETYGKNRIRRAMDAFANAIVSNFTPNKYDNSPEGWDAMEGMGAELLAVYADQGAIKNVDYINDFKVDRVKSQGDETYFDVWIQPVASAEKLYFTINTQ